MPKVKVSDAELANRTFRALLEGKKAMERWDDKRVAGIVGVCIPTLIKRKKDAGTMPISEFRRYVKTLGMTDKDVCAVIGVPYRGET